MPRRRGWAAPAPAARWRREGGRPDGPGRTCGRPRGCPPRAKGPPRRASQSRTRARRRCCGAPPARRTSPRSRTRAAQAITTPTRCVAAASLTRCADRRSATRWGEGRRWAARRWAGLRWVGQRGESQRRGAGAGAPVSVVGVASSVSTAAAAAAVASVEAVEAAAAAASSACDKGGGGVLSWPSMGSTLFPSAALPDASRTCPAGWEFRGWSGTSPVERPRAESDNHDEITGNRWVDPTSWSGGVLLAARGDPQELELNRWW